MYTKHGMYGTKLYWVWDSMLNRTSNPKHKYYADYGGRGISVCKEWKDSFENFYKWATNNGYKEGLTLDRTNNNGNYCPENCRWITHFEQQSNKRNNHFLTYNGERHTVMEWSRILDIPHGTLFTRIRRGWTTERILGTPNIPRRRKQNV